MPIADEIRLRHMLDAARKVATLVRGKSRSILDQDEVLALALVRLVEIIGEAATGTSAAVRIANPLIPWHAMSAARNRLIHGYFDVDYDILWQILTVSVPELIAQLEKIVPPLSAP
jgi:uncharacterized protein with HEPN domain